MGLKVLTTAFLLLGFGLIAGYPWFLKQRPHANDPLAARRLYAQQFLAYSGGLLIATVGSGAGALLILRRTREGYRQQALQNLEALVKSEEPD